MNFSPLPFLLIFFITWVFGLPQLASTMRRIEGTEGQEIISVRKGLFHVCLFQLLAGSVAVLEIIFELMDETSGIAFRDAAVYLSCIPLNVILWGGYLLYKVYMKRWIESDNTETE